MAKWSKIKVNPEQINNGNEYTINDNVSIESLNGIVNNSFKAQEDAERALELATGANEANGTVVKINGEPQGTWDATHSQRLYEESANELELSNITPISSKGLQLSVPSNKLKIVGTSTSSFSQIIPLENPVYLSGEYSLKGFVDSIPSNCYINLIEKPTEYAYLNITNNKLNDTKTFSTRTKVDAIWIWIGSGVTIDLEIPLMLCKGGEPEKYGEYNPNRHITNSEAEFLKEEYYAGSNELYIPDQNITKNGITVNVKNGVITANGTATANTDIILTNALNIGAGQYSINFFETLPIVSGVYCNLRYSSGSALGYGSSARTITTTNTITNMNFYVTSGVTLNNFILKPMLVKGINIPYEHNNYNSASHITNPQADLLKSEWEKTVNEFNANLLNGVKGIVVSENGKTIIMPVATSGIGDVGTTYKLKELCPNMKVGKSYSLGFTRNYNDGSNYIYLAGSKSFWSNNTSKVITQEELDGNVSIYSNRFSSGFTEQIIMTDFRINEGELKPYTDWNGEIIHEKDIIPDILFEGSLNTKGATFTSDFTPYEKLRIYTSFYNETAIFELDLTKKSYSGGYTSTHSSITKNVDAYDCMIVNVNDNKDTFTLINGGYQTLGVSTFTEHIGYDIFIYKVEGVKAI